MLKIKKGVVATWIICCVIMQLIPLSMGFLIYAKATSALKEEILISNQVLVNQLHDKIDFLCEKVNMMRTELLLNSEIERFSKLTSDNLEDNRYELSLLTTEISQYSYVYLEQNEFFIYFPSTGIVLSENNAQDVRSYYTLWMKETGISYEEWLNAISIASSYEFAHIGSNENKTDDSITYLSRLSYGSGYNAPIFGVTIDRNVIDRVLEKLDNDNYFQLSVIDDQKRILLSGEDDNASYVPLDDKIYEGKSGSYSTADGTIVRYVESDVLPWKYVCVFQTGHLWQPLKGVQAAMILSSVCAVILGALVMIYFVFKNYQPLKRILNVIRSAGNDVSGNFASEYDYIEENVFHIITEKEKVSTLADKQKRSWRNSYIVNMLKNRAANSPLEMGNEVLLGLNFEWDYFLVITLYVENPDTLFEEEQSVTERERNILLGLIISNVFEELLSKEHRGYVVEVDDIFAALVNVNGTDPDCLFHSIEEIMRYGQTVLENNFGLVIKVAISNICDSSLDVAAMYKQAKEIMEYQILMDQTSIMDAKEYLSKQTDNSQFMLTPEDEAYLNAHIKKYEYEAVAGYIETIFSRAVDSGNASVEMIRYLMFGLINIVMKTINEVYFSWEEKCAKNMKLVNEILQVENISLMKQKLLALVKDLCDDFSNDNHSAQYSDQVKEYVEQNYSSLELNIGAIGEEFGLVPRYLSQVFKEENGIGLLDYINQVRVSHVKEDMIATKDNLEEIALRNGFTNQVTFIRVFKKFEGITPGKYRELNKK